MKTLTHSTSYSPITVSAADMAKAAPFIEELRATVDRAILEQQLAMERRMFDLDYEARRPPQKLTPVAQAALDKLRAHYGLPSQLPPRVNPLDVKHDGLGLRELLCRD